MKQPPIAIGARLKRFPQIITLGVKPNLSDYTAREWRLLRQAQTIYYPTQAFAAHFHAQGKRIFPSLQCHLFEGDKIKQTALFNLLGLSHPRTRVFYGRQREQIRDHFSFPFVAKDPRGSACGRGVYLIRDEQGLANYLQRHHPAYIQEYLPLEGDVRVVAIGFEPVLAYWRRPGPDGFRNNLAQGGKADFAAVPPQAVELAVEAARLCNLDDVGLDVAMVEGRPYLLEANVKYGRHAAAEVGLDLVEYVARKVLAGEL